MSDVLSITGSRRFEPGELVQLVQLAVRLDRLDVLGGLRGEAFEGARLTTAIGVVAFEVGTGRPLATPIFVSAEGEGAPRPTLAFEGKKPAGEDRARAALRRARLAEPLRRTTRA